MTNLIGRVQRLAQRRHTLMDEKKYKGYHKKATSQTTLRIDKREGILAYIVANPDKLLMTDVNLAASLHSEYGRVKGNKDWQFAHTAALDVEHSDEIVFNHILDEIDETGWLKTYVDKDDTYRQYFDTRKLRNYYKWTHKGQDRAFYIERIMKYFYTMKLFACYTLFHEDALNHADRTFTFKLSAADVNEIGKWLNDVHGLPTTRTKTTLRFDEEVFNRFLFLLKPAIEQYYTLVSA